MVYWYLPGEKAKAEQLFAEFAPTLDFYEAVVGPYPWGDEKVGVVETPHLGLENQTINAYGNAYAKAPEGFDWLFQHEFGHEWFANQLTAANWDDYWLHEGFEEYMQPLYGRWREGEARYAVMMDQQRNRIENKAPIVSGKVRTEEEVYEDKLGGPGQDIYYKGAWMLHTLRWLIGDAAWGKAMRLEVYGRADPRPGNFTPRYGSTAEYERFVRQVTGRDLGWFFDVYLRAAPLPELVEARSAHGLTLMWQAPGGRPFPMPVEVSVDGRVVRLAMTGGPWLPAGRGGRACRGRSDGAGPEAVDRGGGVSGMAGGTTRRGGRGGGEEVSEAPTDTALTLALKRSAEMAAVFMIGDGALGLLQASRHVELWRSNLPAVDVLVRPFAGRPGRRRGYGLLQIAAGLALAASLRKKP